MPRPHTAYLIWVFIFLVIPGAILWFAAWQTFWKYRKAFTQCILIALIIGLAWDFFAIKTEIWGWPEQCCALPRVYGLPLEEVLFIVFTANVICATSLIAREIYLNHRKQLR
ncbi:lycopene cyclase domain-containing protein [Candidatus Saccharibacteria bacterium]|nr:lycopene cyclase domain-containing protein [Candidatus Saccharibacteria bacterium]